MQLRKAKKMRTILEKAYGTSSMMKKVINININFLLLSFSFNLTKTAIRVSKAAKKARILPLWVKLQL